MGTDNNFVNSGHNCKDCGVLHQVGLDACLCQQFGCLVATKSGGCLAHDYFESAFFTRLCEKANKCVTKTEGEYQVVVTDMFLSLFHHRLSAQVNLVLNLSYLRQQVLLQL